MKSFTPISALLLMAAAAAEAAPGSGGYAAAKPAAFFLAGDSTTAVQSTGGGGWGNGFLGFLRAGAFGVNLGHNGATTVSFVAGGDWDKVTAYVTDNQADYDTYVTIQFGHNDQKPAANISLAQYQANLQDLATEIKDLGGTPILVTPLTRRSFSGGVVSDSLHNERLATIAAAEATGTTYLDLNAASIAYVNAIGETASHAYNLVSTDNTHLNAWGSVVFGRLVADLLLAEKSDLSAYFTPNQTLSDQIANGVAA